MSDTLWESLCKNASYKLIGALPEIIRNGRPGFPPLKDYPLPSVKDYNLGRRVIRCDEPGEIDFNQVSVTDSLLNGLDTISRFEPVVFQERDIKLNIPLVFSEVRATGRWQIRQRCKGTEGEFWTTRTGTYACIYHQVQIDLAIVFDYNHGKVSSVGVALSDRTRSWANQPEVTMTFDNARPGEIAIIRALVQAIFKGQQEIGGINFKTEVKKVIEGEEVSGRVKAVINTFLDKIFEGTGEGNVPQKMERRFNREWKAMFVPGHPGYLPDRLPESLEHSINYRFNLPIPITIIPRVGWIPDGNAYALFPSAKLKGLRNIRPHGNIAFADGGLKINVPLSFYSFQADGAWSLEQKIKPVCAVSSALLAFGIEDTEENLSPFHKIERDLREHGGPMGKWYVDKYWKHGHELMKLLEHEQFKRDLERFSGLKIWETIMKVVESAGSPDPINFPESLQDDALALLQRAIDYTVDQPVGAVIAKIIDGNYVLAYMGKNYAQVLAQIARQSPPAESFDEVAASDVVSGEASEIIKYPGTWKFICLPLLLASTLRLTTGRDGEAPKVALESSTAQIGHFDFDYMSEFIFVWLIKILTEYVFPALKGYIGDWLKEFIVGFISQNRHLPDGFQKAVDEIWNTPLI
jgi:hypothetical protein